MPFLGREAELAAIRVALASASEGVATVALIRGASGTGKTRLATEAMRLARAEGYRCAWGVGFTDEEMPSLWPWPSITAQLRESEQRDLADANHDDVRHRRFEQFCRIADELTHAANDTPVLVVIDDAHALDAGALLLTRFIVRTLRASRLAVLITAPDPSEATADDTFDAVLDDIARDGLRIRLDAPEAMPAPIADPAEETPCSALSEPGLRGLGQAQRTVLAVIALVARPATIDCVVEISGVSPELAESTLHTAREIGLVVDDGDGVRLCSASVADDVVESVAPGERARLHDRIAEILADSQWMTAEDRAVAVARHRLGAASITHGAGAIDAAAAATREAAALLLQRNAFEAAAHLSRHAVELYDASATAVPVGLLLDAAQAELAAGRLSHARSWFRRAAELADDPVDLALAAIGLGGMWVREHRATADHAAYMHLARRALAAVEADHPGLAIRLRVRIAAEDVYNGTGACDAVELAVEQARGHGDPLVLAEALSLRLHTMLGPSQHASRAIVVDEMIRAAAASDDGFLVLMASLWRTVDLLLRGDPLAERALNELRQHADALQVAAVLFVVSAMDVMRLLRSGDVRAAMAAAEHCFTLGHDLGDADAMAYFGAHVLDVRWLEMRPDDMLDLARSVADAPTLVNGDVAFTAAVALLQAMDGEVDAARALLHRVLRGSLITREFSSNWMCAMFLAGEAAAVLDDHHAAAAIHAELLPFAHLPIMGSLGVVCFGSVERSLGIAARTMGDLDLAVEHLRRSVPANHLLGNRAMALISQGDLGVTLLRRGGADDVAAAANEIERATEGLRAMGLTERAAALTAELDAVAATEPNDTRSTVAVGRVVPRGSVWELHIPGHVVEVPDTVGVQRLIELLERPYTDVPAADLVGGVAPTARHEVMDVTALRAYHDRVRELRADITSAEDDHDLGRAERLRDELDMLLSHLSTSAALMGRSRSFVNDQERARIAVRKSLSRVFDEVALQVPAFAEWLRDCIRTGATCRFQPREGFPLTWVRASADR